jgi:hypothetical protein
MPKLTIAGLAMLEMLIVTLPAVAQELPWCRLGRHGAGRECAWYTQAQCAQSTEWQAVGTCYPNPSYHGASASAPIARHKAVHHRAKSAKVEQ